MQTTSLRGRFPRLKNDSIRAATHDKRVFYCGEGVFHEGLIISEDDQTGMLKRDRPGRSGVNGADV